MVRSPWIVVIALAAQVALAIIPARAAICLTDGCGPSVAVSCCCDEDSSTDSGSEQEPGCRPDASCACCLTLPSPEPAAPALVSADVMQVMSSEAWGSIGRSPSLRPMPPPGPPPLVLRAVGLDRIKLRN